MHHLRLSWRQDLLRFKIIAEDFFSRVFAAGAEDAAAGVAGGAAQVQAADRRAVVGPAGDGAEAEELMGVHRALHDVAAGDAERALQVERREDLAVLDRARHVRRVFGEHFDAAVGELFFDVVPGRVPVKPSRSRGRRIEDSQVCTGRIARTC